MSANATWLATGLARAWAGEAIEIEQSSPARWTWALVNGATHRMEVQLEDRWVLFREPAHPHAAPPTPEALWAVLRQNAGLPAHARRTLRPSKQPGLCAELLLTDAPAMEPRLREVLAAMQVAWACRPSWPVADLSTEDGGAHLERCCEEIGWGCVRRSSGRLTVALEAIPALQATLSPAASGSRVSVEVGDFSSSSEASRAAAAVLALESTSHVPMVRATTDEHGGRMGFEVMLAATPSPAELEAGLAALSLVAAAAVEPLQALQNDTLAGDYLAIRGWPATKQEQATERKHI